MLRRPDRDERLSRPGAVTDDDTSAGSAPSWGAALDDFAALLDRIERQLADDAWTAASATLTTSVPVGTPSAADRARGAALLARAAEQTRRLERERDLTAVELGDLGRRRHAARSYQS